MFSIGEFSKLTGLTVKTLRFYHEESLLVPTHVDPDSGYRYYADRQIEDARIITYLRSLEFPITEIRELLNVDDNEDFLQILERRRSTLQDQILRLRGAARSISRFIAKEREAIQMAEALGDVEIKTIEPQLIAGIRMQGKYSECCHGFSKIGRSFGRYIVGPPILLQYDGEYREQADFEACFPIRRKKEVKGISIRELPQVRCVCLIHKGPYDQLGRSYAKALQYIKERKLKLSLPTREIYLKGPGMIFKGNPENYLTEIQVPFDHEPQTL